MGGKCPHRKVKKRRFSHKSNRRAMFLSKGDDLVYNEILKQAEEEKAKTIPLDVDLPGLGQFYCVHCARYFASDEVREDHYKTKLHKKKVKQLMVAPHTQLDADLAAGMGMPDNGVKLMSI